MDRPPTRMALITSDCDATRSPRIKRPQSPRVVIQRTQTAAITSGFCVFVCVCNQMCINCIIVSQARPHKSVNTRGFVCGPLSGGAAEE